MMHLMAMNFARNITKNVVGSISTKCRMLTAIGAALTLLPIGIGSAFVLLRSLPAEACRDCPFPLRIDRDRWLMPNGKLEIEIQESASQSDIEDKVLVTVYLIDPETRQVLASGQTSRYKDHDHVIVMLYDSDGSLIKGDISWHGGDKEQLRAKFYCVTICAISP